MRYCKNCGWETHYPRWCDDCWRMIVKTCASQFAVVACGWLVTHLLSSVAHALAIVISDIVRVF